MITLSQIIFGVQDLDRATLRFEELGFTVVDGGHHPNVGTANRIVPLGAQYIELLAVVDRRRAEQNEYGRSLLARVARGDGLVRWSLRTDDIDAVAGRLSLPVERRSRVRPDGVKISWRAAGLSLALAEPWLPFFMQWDRDADYPGAIDVTHRNGARSVTYLEVSTPSATSAFGGPSTPSATSAFGGPSTDDRFARWTESADAPLRVVDTAPPGVRRVSIATREGLQIID